MTRFSPHQDALFIDIDGTLTDWIGQTPVEGNGLLLGQSLLWLMRQAALEQRGMDPAEAQRRIQHINDTVSWWHWTDFLLALELDAHRFWQFAYERESAYLGPVSTDLPIIFDRLHKAGYKMFITSNNPSSGILHKLRLAGLADIFGSRYFMQYFSPCDLHHMKADPQFWRRALAHSGLCPRHVVVIGDSWNDDIQVPAEAGISRRIHLNPSAYDLVNERAGVRTASSWQKIAQLLLDAGTAPSLADKSSRAAKNLPHMAGMT